jgi:hypothetical protein
MTSIINENYAIYSVTIVNTVLNAFIAEKTQHYFFYFVDENYGNTVMPLNRN